MTAQVLWMNIPPIVLVIVLWVGVPLWMVLRHPDRDPRETRTTPAYLRQRAKPTARPVTLPAPRQALAENNVKWRDLVSADRN